MKYHTSLFLRVFTALSLLSTISCALSSAQKNKIEDILKQYLFVHTALSHNNSTQNNDELKTYTKEHLIQRAARENNSHNSFHAGLQLTNVVHNKPPACFTGPLVGDIIGTQEATVVTFVGDYSVTEVITPPQSGGLDDQ